MSDTDRDQFQTIPTRGAGDDEGAAAELSRVKAEMRATIEQYDRDAEKSEAASRALETRNEELRSAAAAFESSQGVLESANQELQGRIDEITQAREDLRNLMSSTDMGTIFVDRSLRVKLFTSRVADLFDIGTADAGRPLRDIPTRLEIDDLGAGIERVLEGEQSIEREIATRDGRWYHMRILPYRTSDGGVEGAVLTFVDVSERRHVEEALRANGFRQSYLLRLGDALRPLSDPAQIQRVASALLGHHLGSDRACYVEIDEETAEYVVAHDWHRDGDTSHTRRYPLSDWPAPWLADGKPWVIRDVDTDPAMPDDQRAAYRANAIGACIVVPLIKNGRVVATFVTSHHESRRWTQDDVLLVQETAERTWAALEQARAERALRESQDILEQRVRARTRELQEQSVVRRQLLERVVTTAEEERQRIARELHDELGQQLTALKVGLEALSLQDDRVQQLKAIVAGIDGKIDRLTLELRPPVLDDLGLHGAIATLSEQFTAGSGVPVNIHVRGDDRKRVSSAIETTLYRVLQEALTNVWKHSGAKSVSVILELMPALIQLIVEDDGRGFTVTDEARPGGLGLVGMRERVELVGGTFSIESGAGGTAIYVRVPLDVKARE